MLKVIPSTIEHFNNLQLQEAQAFCAQEFAVNPDYAHALITSGIARTGIDSTGKVIAIMGLTFRHNNCAESWALFSPSIKNHIKSIIKEVRLFLKEHSHVKRIYCTASVDYPQAHKLITSFGFKAESILECWDIFGNDHIMYVKINNSIYWETR